MLYNKNNLAVAKIAGGADCPVEIQCVFFTQSKTVATDRYRLLEVFTPEVDMTELSQAKFDGKSYMRGHKPFLVLARDLESADFRLKDNSQPPLCSVGVTRLDNKKVGFLHFDANGAASKILPRLAGTFPAYEKIIPAGKPRAEVVLDSKLLKGLLAVMGDLDNKITFKVYDMQKPVVLECSDGKQKARGAIMPIKI